MINDLKEWVAKVPAAGSIPKIEESKEVKPIVPAKIAPALISVSIDEIKEELRSYTLDKKLTEQLVKIEGKEERTKKVSVPEIKFPGFFKPAHLATQTETEYHPLKLADTHILYVTKITTEGFEEAKYTVLINKAVIFKEASEEEMDEYIKNLVLARPKLSS